MRRSYAQVIPPILVLTDLSSVLTSRVLTPEEIASAARALVNVAVSDEDKATFLQAWARRGETAAELAACAEAFLPQALDLDVRGTWNGQRLLDCCGTGGGGLNLINISTGLMFVLGAMGVPVVKHGNRGVTKKSGSADVLEALGIRIDLAPGRVRDCLEEVGCAFLFAPAYHPSFAAVGNVRRRLAAEGQRTVFNLLGPLLNPARPESRLVGVFHSGHVALYGETLELMKCPAYTVACGTDAASGRALGEVGADGETLVRGPLFSEADGRLRFVSKNPQAIESLLVEDAAASARLLGDLLRGSTRGLGREMLLVNAAVAAWTQGNATSLEEGLAKSEEAIDSGRAYACLQRWQKFSDV